MILITNRGDRKGKSVSLARDLLRLADADAGAYMLTLVSRICALGSAD